MADRVNFTDSVLTARKYVSMEGKSEQLATKLASLSNRVNITDRKAQMSAFDKILSDNVITPEEKISLRAEMDHIDSAFIATTASVTSLGLENCSEYLLYKQQYDILKQKVEAILSDMNTSTEIAEPISRYIEGYSSAADTLNSYMIAFSNKSLASVSDFQLVVDVSNVSPTPDDSITFTAKVMKKNNGGIFEEMPQSQYDTYKSIDDDGNAIYPKLFIWDISGTSDDDGYKKLADGHKTVTIPASAFAQDSISVRFYSDILIS